MDHSTDRWIRLLLCFGLLLAMRPVAAGQVVKVGIYDNSPKIFIDESGRPSGFFIELLEEIARREAWRLDYVPCQWHQCLEKLEVGEIDLLPDVAYSAERARRFAFGREVVLSSWSVFYTAQGERLLSLKALDGRKVAVVRGSIQYQSLKRQAEELGIQPDYVEMASMEEVFQQVREGEVRAGLVNTWFGQQHARQFDLHNSRVLVRPSLLYIAASPAAASLLPVIDTHLTAWKQDNNSPYHQAMKRWVGAEDERKLYRWLIWAVGVALLLLILAVFLGLLVRKLVRDRTADLEEKRARLDHLAHHDPLTGLPNRLLFFDRLKQCIRQSRRSRKNLALLFLDLDQFKQINDTFGHAVGDQLLQDVADRLRKAIRETDTVARIGGDEFAVIMGGLNEPADVVVGVQHLYRAFADPFMIPGHQFAITLSIGISIYPQDGADAQTLLRNADTAMFRAKEVGRNTYQLYDEEMTSEAVARARMETFLRTAVENGEIEVYYQPKVSLESGRLIGFEALARWHHAELGEIPPDRFIPLAEESGLILQLGRQIMETACGQVASWQAESFDTGPVAVNLSGKQLRDPSLIETVSHVIDQSGCEPLLLEFEVTEGFVMRQVDESIATMRRLRSIGIELAIDDFGTGYSSLAYLKVLPVSRLKIDRSFIAGIPSDENDMAIVRAVIALGRILGLKVIAEGVETAQQAQFLRDAGCDEAQGFYFGEPAPAGHITTLLADAQGAGLAWRS